MEVPTQAIIGTDDGDHKNSLIYLDNKDIALVKKWEPQHRLYFALLLTHYRRNLNFHFDPSLILPSISLGLSEKLDVPNCINIPSKRTLAEYRKRLRAHFNMRIPTKHDHRLITDWLVNEILPHHNLTPDEIRSRVECQLRHQCIEFFTDKTIQRLIQSAINTYEKKYFQVITQALSAEVKACLDGLLLINPEHYGLSYFGWIGTSYNKPSLDGLLSLLKQITYLKPICTQIEGAIITSAPNKRLTQYAAAIARYNPSDIKALDDVPRYAQLALYAVIRYQTIIDQAVDMFSHLSRNMVHKSEKKVVKTLVNEVKTIFGKEAILCSMAEICLEQPDSTIKEAIFPIVSEEKLANLIKDIRKKGPKYQIALHEKIKSSYANYYRRMSEPFLTKLSFHCTNPSHKPLLDGLQLIRDYFNSNTTYFPKSLSVPINFVPKKWRDRIIDPTNKRIKRTAYEVYVLKRLGDLLQCREIWVESAFKYRNPDQDIPPEFNADQALPYEKLNLNQDVVMFIEDLKKMHSKALSEFNQQITKNKKISLSSKKGGCIHVTPLDAQKESQHLKAIKKQMIEEWPLTSLLDALKEVELRLGLTTHFVSHGEKVYLKPRELSLRILLAIYGFGTNAGMKSEVGFAFSFLLGFMLMPRFANLSRQKLYQCELGDYQKYVNLQHILTDTINWDLIKAEYPQMAKYAAAMKEGHADPESLLKRFNRNNISHPTYQALAQLGKVIKTIFICNYLMEESIRREVHEGLNVVELWNGVSKFIFYGRAGEISSNNPKDHVLSMLCLHLLQISMVYINTLMLQEIIIKNGWLSKLTAEDKRALTPLLYGHINPYGLFPLDFEKRINLGNYREAA